MIKGVPRLTEMYYQFPGRKRWETPPSLSIGHMFSPNYRRKYVFENGQECIREIGEELFNDNGLIDGIDDK